MPGRPRRAFVDPSPKYLEDYSNLQRVKHDLIRCYLAGWYPKLGFWSGRIVYLDTHAGRGRHADGQQGSPIVALETLLSHHAADRILARSEVVYEFIERDEENCVALKREIEALEPIPGRVCWEVSAGECFEKLEFILDDLKSRGQKNAPAFIFVDPYGFKVPGALLAELMSYERVELFVNVIWRELDMAIRQAPDKPGMAETVDAIFNSMDWRGRITSEDHAERAQQAALLYQEMVGAQWGTSMRMLGANNATRYLLLHLTNHPAGRDLMKDCMWNVAPDGQFVARKTDNPSQQILLMADPNLAPLEAWVLDVLADRPHRWSDLEDMNRNSLWRTKHLNQVIRKVRREGTVEAFDFSGKFSRKANPQLRLA